MVTRGTRESSNTRLDADTFRPLVESDRGDRSLNDSPVGQGAHGAVSSTNQLRGIACEAREEWERKGKRKKGKREEGQREREKETVC